MKVNGRILLVLAVILLSTVISEAQCAMCKASAESSLENGGTIARGVNNGIIYLMGVPYLLLGTFCIVFRRDIAAVYHRWRKTDPNGGMTLFQQYRFMVVFFGLLTVIFMIFAYIQLS